MADISTSPWLTEALDRESTKKHFIEYEIFKSSHMAHGIIALHKLGASENRITDFINTLGKYLEPPDYANHKGENPDAPAIDEKELDNLLGKRKHFYEIKNRFKIKLEESGSLETFIRNEFPALSRGMSCSALHGLIHVGYGYNARSPTVVCEGIAYLHHSYSPLLFYNGDSEISIENFGKGTCSILEVLEQLRSDEKLRELMLDGAKKFAESDWDSSTFQYRLKALMEEGTDVMEYANKINIPCVSADDHVETIQVADWIMKQAIAVYVMSERVNDFFLVHGITGAWSLKQIIPVLKRPDALDALRTFTCMLFGVYMAQDTPRLMKPPTRPGPTNDTAWKNLIDEALSRPRDEHVFKMIQVTYEVWQENKDSDIRDMCTTAAELCLRNDFSYIKK